MTTEAQKKALMKHAQGREDSRWMRERIAELEAENERLRKPTAAEHALMYERLNLQAEVIDLRRREQELVEMARALKPNQASSISEVCLWRDEGWDALQKALAAERVTNSNLTAKKECAHPKVGLVSGDTGLKWRCAECGEAVRVIVDKERSDE